MLKFKKNDFTSSFKIYFEHFINLNGDDYLLIFAHHINGGLIAIPDWNICCEASAYCDDIVYNTSKLTNSGLDEKTAKKIATYIDEWLKNR